MTIFLKIMRGEGGKSQKLKNYVEVLIQSAVILLVITHTSQIDILNLSASLILRLEIYQFRPISKPQLSPCS